MISRDLIINSLMRKWIKRFFILFAILLIIILSICVFLYFKFSVNKNVIADNLTEEINIILPKSETFKVTSTAKGDNQSKIARLNTDVFTYYLDNSGCTDANARGNDKSLQLIHIKDNGDYEIFDTIPVWMHGNVLVDEALQRIYYTTYEEAFIDGAYYNSVKIYTYVLDGTDVTRINVETLADDQINPGEANPRVGADIDRYGNIAIAFSDYRGIMYVHVYDKEHQLWIKHVIEYYQDTYLWDSNLYPYVRLEGVDCIKVLANRDTSIGPNGEHYENPLRDYTRYFSYNGSSWTHSIIADVRDKNEGNKNGYSAAPLDLFIDDEQNAHIITKEANTFHYYIINPEGDKTELDLKGIRHNILVTFIRIVEINDKRYFVVSGDGINGIEKTGYVEVYDFETHKLLYRNHSICKTPYLFLAKGQNSNSLDMMMISRDKAYAENSETHYIKLQME